MAASVTDFFFFLFKFLRSNLRASGPREPTGPIAAGEESRIEKKVAFVLGSCLSFLPLRSYWARTSMFVKLDLKRVLVMYILKSFRENGN